MILIKQIFCISEFIAPIVVGVVGIGHVPGIQENWEKEVDIKELLR